MQIMKKAYFEYTVWYKAITLILFVILLPVVLYLVSGIKLVALAMLLVMILLTVVYALLVERSRELMLIDALEKFSEKTDDVPETEIWETNYAWIDRESFTCCISVLVEGIHLRGSSKCSMVIPWSSISKIQLYEKEVSCLAKLFLQKSGSYNDKVSIPWNDELTAMLPNNFNMEDRRG